MFQLKKGIWPETYWLFQAASGGFVCVLERKEGAFVLVVRLRYTVMNPRRVRKNLFTITFCYYCYYSYFYWNKCLGDRNITTARNKDNEPLIFCSELVSDLHTANRDESVASLQRGPPRKCKTSSAAAMATGHVPPVTLAAQAKVPTGYQSAIARHLIERECCRSAYDDTSFRVLSNGRRKRHLEVLEAVYIRTHSPALCMQKQQLVPLKLLHTLT